MYPVQFALHCKGLLNHISLVTNDVFFSNIIHFHFIFIFLSLKEKLFCCQNLVCDCSSRTCICSFSFYSHTNLIAWALPMWSCKEVILHCKIKNHIVHQINGRFKIFMLWSCSITNILNSVNSEISCTNYCHYYWNKTVNYSLICSRWSDITQ